MTASLRQILDELADQIRNVYEAADEIDVQVEPRLVPNPTPPTIDMYPADLPRDPDTAAYGDLAGAYLITVRARIATNDADAMQDLLVDMMDDQHDLSLLGAAFDDETLNGYASSMDLRDQTGFRVYEDTAGLGAYVGFQFTALVFPGDS